MKVPDPRLLTTREIALFVGVSKRTIQTWVQKGIIGHLKIGKVIRFDATRVLRDLEAFEVPVKSGRPSEVNAESPTQTRHVDESQGAGSSLPCCDRLEGIDGNVEMKGAEVSQKRAGSASANGQNRPNQTES